MQLNHLPELYIDVKQSSMTYINNLMKDVVQRYQQAFAHKAVVFSNTIGPNTSVNRPLPALCGTIHKRGNSIRLRVHHHGWRVAFVKPSSLSRRQQSTYQNNCRGYLCGALCCYGGRVAGGGREKSPESLQKTFRDS